MPFKFNGITYYTKYIKYVIYSVGIGIKQVSHCLRQHYQANRIFKGYDDIVDAWYGFIIDVKRV